MNTNELWKKTKEIIKKELSKETFEKWIEPLKIHESSEGDKLVFIAPKDLNVKELKKYENYVDNTIYFSFDIYKLISFTFEN